MRSQQRLDSSDAVARLARKDATLWSVDPEVQKLVTDRLGFVGLATDHAEVLREATLLANGLAHDGVSDLVLLGMGGSSLAALTMGRVFAGDAEGVRLHVVDTTSPTTIEALMSDLDPATTAFFVSSKSGSTIEPNTLYSAFKAWAEPTLDADLGRYFIAITDPGSSLESLASAEGFRTTLITPSDVGGRFSALTHFGIAPAACTGMDVAALLMRAQTMEERCRAQAGENPAAALAAFIADARDEGRDKLTIVTSPGLRAFGLWAEQLIAESTGKQGVGVIPIPELAEHTPAGYGEDRAVVVLRLAGDAELASWASKSLGSFPIFDIELADRFDLGAEFVRWEYATALVGYLLGINPFDEPNVAEAKAATLDVLEKRAEAPAPDCEFEGVRARFGGGLSGDGVDSIRSALSGALGALGNSGYLALLAYLPDDDALLSGLRAVIPPLAAATGHATVFELGPRYLHSTGQLHKGGPAEGVFVVVTARDEADVAVPGQSWTLRDLFNAQAAGDFLTLAKHGRPVVWLDLPNSSPESLAMLADALVDDALVSR